ncbi:sensor histidine kinase [Luteolibacter sp. GHJ8]|uniref:histidine kinase n=1 Tax=Luteolibacter rhizosphaerae TaxID=2989719 RepID=A0ABT3FZG6_9BACT|nr:sensor histidine kinase [Luteolibacter rhizosphaerae]MCW1912988.1 sensor histidine kinase [Luteolibacter rhizosphaerae]
MRLYQFISDNIDQIVREWEEFARKIWPAGDQGPRLLRDHADEMLLAVIKDMQRPQSPSEQRGKATGEGPTSRESELVDHSSVRHAASRAESGFDLRSLVAEYRALRASVLHLWSLQSDQEPEHQIGDMTRFNEAVDQLLAKSIVHYAERIDHSREIFLGILAHDLRTPLHALAMVSGMLEQHGDLSGLALKMASQIAVSVRAMEKMISDLLEFTGMRLGAKMIVARQVMDLEKLCLEVVEEMRAAHPSHTFSLVCDIDPSGAWDRARLRQVISNLLGNAVQHGSPTAPISLFLEDNGGDVLLGVRNFGVPIPKEFRSVIFDPLRRNSGSDLSRPPGSIGLGLYIAREVASAHGGSINVQSDENETVFIVRLPREVGGDSRST